MYPFVLGLSIHWDKTVTSGTLLAIETYRFYDQLQPILRYLLHTIALPTFKVSIKGNEGNNITFTLFSQVFSASDHAYQTVWKT